MRIRHSSVATLFAALSAGPAAAFVPQAANHDLEFPLLYDSAARLYVTERAADLPALRSSSLEPTWMVQPNPRTGTLHVAYGGGVQLGSAVTSQGTAEALAQDFLLDRADLLGVRTDNMQLRSVRHWNGKYAVHYRQVLLGLPVHTATAWVLMDESGRVAAFGSDFIPDNGDIPAHATLSGAQAVDRAAAALGTTPRTDAPVEVFQLYVPAPAGELLELTPAYQVVFESTEPFGKWESTVHGLTGEILARRNLYFPINVTGTVGGDVENQLPTLSYCDGSATEPLANLTVSVSGGNSDATDAAGAFNINHGGTAPVTVNAQLSGPYINVNRFTGLGADASISQGATPGTPVALSFTTGNARRDEMDTFFHGNLIRDFMVGLDATFTNLDVPVVSWVGRTDGFCPGNAWWNLGGANMNFCESDFVSYGNTGQMADVIYHEYGHGITEMVYSRNGQAQPVGDLHEGNSDVVANFLDRNPHIGLGFFLNNCTSGIRNASNTLQWPGDNDGGHSGGQIIAGFHWDAWQSMLGAMPQAQADSIAFHTWHFARDMGTPADQADQVLWTFMVDDDDADVTNGTPNHDHFCLAATNHGFACTFVSPVSITHTPLPHTTDDVNGYDVVATIISSATSLDPSALEVIYNLDGGGDVALLMSPTGNPDEYSATIPAQDQHSELEYYISATDMAANTNTDPPFALIVPFPRHAFDVAAAHDDLESGVGGWTTSVSGATTGAWELVDPIGTLAQPEDDSTPNPGVNAWITQQCSGPLCSPCALGCTDIDGGSVILLSPVYDMTGFDQVTVKYDRWYCNNPPNGADPNNDFWVVEISNDGGSSWTTVENTWISAVEWLTASFDVDAAFGTPGQVRLRFTASDLINPSVVEAGVDEVRVLAQLDAAVATVDVAAAPAALALEQNQPNPFSPETSIRFALPQRAEIHLAVYDVHGRAVRQLAGGAREAGRYDVTWNGRDSQGSRVAAGVYFYRLTAGGEVLTRKMTVLK